MASEVPVDVYFDGDFPETAIAKVEVAIEEHKWGVDGLMEASEVTIVQTASSTGSKDNDGGSLPIGAIVGGAVAAVVVCVAAYCCCFRKEEEPVAKAELDTDQESDEDEDKKKVAITTVEARAVR